MPEAPAAPAPAAPPAPPAPAAPPVPDLSSTLIAGKFKDAQAAEKGYRELNNSLGLPAIPDTKPLLGEGAPFPDAVALESGYKVLEQLQGKKAEAAKPPTTPVAEIKAGEPLEIKAPPTPAPPAADEDPDFDSLLSKAGLTRAELYEQWNKPAEQGGGKLTDDQYAKAKKVGWGRKITDTVVGTQVIAHQAGAAEVQRTAIETAGGREKLGALLGWAGGKYSPAEAADLQRRLNNPALTASVVKQLQYEYAESIGAGGSHPTVNGGSPATSSTGAIADPAEYATLLEKVNAGTATKAEEARFYATNPNIALKA